MKNQILAAISIVVAILAAAPCSAQTLGNPNFNSVKINGTPLLPPRINPMTYGAVADGSSHPLSARFTTLASAQAVFPFVTSLSQEQDYAAIQAAINAAIVAKVPEIYLPSGRGCYQTTTTISENMSGSGAAPVSVRGDGKLTDCIRATGLAGPLLQVAAGTGQKLYFNMRGVALTGDNTAGSTGLQINAVAYAHIEDMSASAFTYGLDATDVDQGNLTSDEFTYNANGVRFNAALCCTGPNSIAFFSTTIAKNTQTGLSMNAGGIMSYTGGSIQYNGVTGGGTGQYGARLVDMTNALFSGVDMEGNGGNADLDFDNANQPGTFEIDDGFFLRTYVFGPPYNYATYHILQEGTQTQALSLHANRFLSNGGYVPSASRPDIFSSDSASRQPSDDGSNIYQDALEAPAWNGGVKFPQADAVPFSPIISASTGTLGGYTTNMYVSKVAGAVSIYGTVAISDLGTAVGTLNMALPYVGVSGLVSPAQGINLTSAVGIPTATVNGPYLQAPVPSGPATLTFSATYPVPN